MQSRSSRYRKRFGQHFLTSSVLAKKIVDSARVCDHVVLEIGAGKGILTRHIAQEAQKVFAVEIDEELASTLETLALPHVVVINENFLRLSLADYEKPIVIGNIPYSITTLILEKLIRERDYFEWAVLTLQKEYAERILAQSGSRKYGAITIYVQYYFSTKKIVVIPSRYFSPRPKVSSVVVSFIKKTPPFTLRDEKRFFDFIQGVFRYRRKSLKNAILHHLGTLPEGIDEHFLSKRPEHLTLDDFHNIYTIVAAGR